MDAAAHRNALLARLKTSGDDIVWAASLLAEWPHEPVDDIWPAHQQVAHLLAVEVENYHVRIARILAEDCPELVSWDSEAFAASYRPEGDLAALAESFARERARTVAMFTAATPDQQSRSAIWPDGTLIDLTWLAEKALWHTLDHTQQLVDLHQEFAPLQGG
jgi:hypothetical protein